MFLDDRLGGVLDRNMIAWCLIVEQACELDEAMYPNIKGQGLLVSDKKIFKGFPYISIYKTRRWPSWTSNRDDFSYF